MRGGRYFYGILTFIGPQVFDALKFSESHMSDLLEIVETQTKWETSSGLSVCAKKS